eukprot:c1787_g1_i1 orf=114-305(+)
MLSFITKHIAHWVLGHCHIKSNATIACTSMSMQKYRNATVSKQILDGHPSSRRRISGMCYLIP